MVRSKNTIATPPGATIREQLEDRGMTQKNFALRMNLSEKHVSQLINGDVRLTPGIAERLEMVLGIRAKNKWVPEVKTQEQKVVELRKFFEVAKLTIIENPAITNIACRRLNESEKSDFALLAWSQQARREARNIDTEPINIMSGI